MTSVTAGHISISRTRVVRYRFRRVYPAARWRIAGNDETRAPRARYHSRSPSVYRLFPCRASKSPSASASLRFASLMSARARARPLDANEEGNGRRGASRAGPPVHQRSLRYRSPFVNGTPHDRFPESRVRTLRIRRVILGYSSTSTTLARLHARRPLSTFQRGECLG